MGKKRPNKRHRLERCFRRLGTRNPVCVICGEDDPHCLELHHIAGIDNHDDTVILCRNCHRKLTDMQHDHASPLSTDVDDESVKAGRYIQGLGDVLTKLGPSLKQLGDSLIRRPDQKEDE